MNTVAKIIPLLGSACLLMTSGCAIYGVKSAHRMEVVDTNPGQPSRGYVEFTSVSKDAVIPIYLLDEQRHPHLLAATGILQGELYSFSRYKTLVGEKVRVAVPPGTHTFMLDKDGEIIRVPVETGKVTPVEINYTIIHRGVVIDVYSVTHQMFQPVELKESPKKG